MKRTALIIALGFAATFAGCQPKVENDGAKSENSTIETIMARRSIRNYKPAIVSRDTMQIIANCGINAPSGMNMQPWAIRIVDNQQLLDEMTQAWLASMNEQQREKMTSDKNFRNMFRNAPTVVFIANPADGNGAYDCGLLSENMMLAAQSMGIGSCCLGGPIGFLKSDAAKKFVEKLDLPEGYSLLYAIGFGYPNETPDAKPRDNGKVKFID